MNPNMDMAHHAHKSVSRNTVRRSMGNAGRENFNTQDIKFTHSAHKF